MKKLYSLIFILSVFLIGCGSKDSVTNAVTEKPATGTLTAVYDESNTSKSISVGDALDSYTGNFELTYNNGTTSSSITVTKDMISLDTSSVGEKVATISYNGASTTVSAIVCTKASDFTRSLNTITAYSGSASSVVVPRYISGTEITTLGNAVFKEKTTLTSVIANNLTTIADGYDNSSSAYAGTFLGCINLTSISLPKVTSIGDGAFYECTSLTSIFFPLATSIGEGAFSECTSLSSIFFPLATSIGEGAFYECTSLTSVSLPKVTNIGNGAFQGCSNLISISFSLVTSIGHSAFDHCTNLTSISLPLVTSVGYYAFAYCPSLNNVILPNATTIGYCAFWYDTNLTNINLPKVTSIGNNALMGCTSLTSIIFGTTTPPTLGSQVFSSSGLSKSWTINVPAGTSSAYSTAFSSASNTFNSTSTPTYAEY